MANIQYTEEFAFYQQLKFYYDSNRGKIRSRYNDLTKKFLAYNDKNENPYPAGDAAVRGAGACFCTERRERRSDRQPAEIPAVLPLPERRLRRYGTQQ